MISSEMRRAVSEGSWSTYPGAAADPHAGRTEFGDDGCSLSADPSTRVVGLGAVCGLNSPVADNDGRSGQSFWVSEFALLADGRRVILHEERGFSCSRTLGTMGARPVGVRFGHTADSITRDVLSVVLPDEGDDCQDDHPWSWLAELARSRGLNVGAGDLLGLPYEVVFTANLKHWLLPS